MTKKMTPVDAARIQAANAVKNDGTAHKDSFAARAQRAAASNTKPENGPSTTGKPSGKGRGNNPPKGK